MDFQPRNYNDISLAGDDRFNHETIVKIVPTSKDFVVETKAQTHKFKTLTQSARKVLTYDDEGITTCSKNYTPIHNDDLIDVVGELLDKRGIQHEPVEVESRGRWGFKNTFIIDRDVMLDERDESMYDLGISFTNSYDLSIGINVAFYLGRVICTNGMYVGKFAEMKRMTHTSIGGSRLALIDKVKTSINGLLDKQADTVNSVFELIDRDITPEKVTAILRKLHVRKYELEHLKTLGVSPIYEENTGEIIGAMLDTERIRNRFDFLNAITNTANVTSNDDRQFELQRRIAPMLMT